MLSDRERELIACAIGGRLSTADTQLLRLLLDHSREARRLARALRREREALRNLPVRPAPDTILPGVMARIAGTNPFETLPSTTARTQRRRPVIEIVLVASIVVAFAASVMLGVQSLQNRAIEKEQALSLPSLDDAPESQLPEPKVVVSRIPRDEEPLPTVAELPETAPAPRQTLEEPRPVLGAPYVPPTKLDTVVVRLPLMLTASELLLDSSRRQIVECLAQKSPARIDVFSTDTVKAAELFIATGRAAGVNLILDAPARERLRVRNSATWLLHCESLTPEEIACWLAKLAGADASAFRGIHFPAPTPTDVKDLKDLLGLDLQKAIKPGVGKSISARTVDEVAAVLGKDKDAILVTYLPANARANPASSREIRHWYERRGERKPGTISVTFMIR